LKSSGIDISKTLKPALKAAKTPPKVEFSITINHDKIRPFPDKHLLSTPNNLANLIPMLTTTDTSRNNPAHVYQAFFSLL
jgi:hypothetical protein